MKRSGIAEAYLMPIEGPDQKPLPEPPIVQLSPIWWAMVPHAMQAADRLGPMRTFASTATFRNLCMWQEPKIEGKRYWLNLGTMACIAAWTAPSRVEISKQLRPSANEVEISVTNTWANRRIGVRHLPSDFSATRTSASPMSEDVELQLSGLLGPVEIVTK